MQMAPGYIVQAKQTCDDCGGQGENIKKENICKKCKGEKLMDEKREIEVHIQPGTKTRDHVVLEDEGHQHPDY